LSTERSIHELMSLNGRVALVTGGAGHIGRAVANGLAELGANLALSDIAASGGEEAAATLSGRFPGSAAAFACVAGLAYIASFIAGATSTGASFASNSELRRSSAMPAAARARRLAVAGATMMTEAPWLSAR